MNFNSPEQLNAFDRMFPTVDVNDVHSILVRMVRRAMIVEANGTAGDYTEEGIAAEALAELIDIMLPHDQLGQSQGPLVMEADPEFERLLAEEEAIQYGIGVGDIVVYGSHDYPWRVTAIHPGPNIGVGAMPSYNVRIIPNTPTAMDSTDAIVVSDRAVRVIKRHP